MCGIVGIIDSENKFNRELAVQRMNESIFHRGPDDEGIFSDDYCTLAMRRLSIIDINNGKQPIYSECGNYLIFFNGEIYNYVELKNILLSQNCQFTTNSDTEVVVNLYKYFGKEMLYKLNGMYAFCIYDLNKKSYFFARDRFGEKPFFYYKKDKSFIFSSEIKSLLNSKEFDAKLNKSKLGSYIRFGFVDEPFTLLEDVYTLPPGHYLEISADFKIKITSFIENNYKPDKSIKNLNDAVEFIRPSFESAVKKQMISDVPIGAFLSGGIDSSSVVAIMAKLSPKPIKTFTVKFQTKGYDESSLARKVASKYNTDHHQILIENSQFKEEQFWKILHHVGLPFADSSAIPTDIVTSEIAKHVKVALSGDGGDEIFGGYTVFDWVNKINKISLIPNEIRKIGYNSISIINKNLNSNKLRQLSKVLKFSNYSIPKLIQETHALFDIEEVNELFSGELDYPIFTSYNSRNSLLRNSMAYRTQFDLPLDMLIKVDRMSMANSLEVRCPFLDPILYEQSCKLPDKFLRNNGLGKIVIRKMMENDLPEEVFSHPKSGFSIPLHDFKNTDFKKLAHELLNKSYMHDLFNKYELDRILKLGLESNKDSSSGSIYRLTHQLWCLMMLSGWIQLYNVEV
jgi:asparagine synthase (glutamine-hydrolysing)